VITLDHGRVIRDEKKGKYILVVTINYHSNQSPITICQPSSNFTHFPFRLQKLLAERLAFDRDDRHHDARAPSDSGPHHFRCMSRIAAANAIESKIDISVYFNNEHIGR
jgi:hypothetical protein